MSSLRRKIRRGTAIISTTGIVYTKHGTKGGSKGGSNSNYNKNSTKRNFKGYCKMQDTVAMNNACMAMTLPLTVEYSKSGQLVHIQHPKWNGAYKGA